MNDDFGYALCGMYSHYEIIKILLEYKQKCPECFYDNFHFDAVFGNFQFCVWDGGRIFPTYKHATLEDVIELKHFYNDIHNIPIRFIYTNTKIEPQHLDDRFCNEVTELCENTLNEIVVNSPVLEKYLKENYPSYKYISSTTKCVLDKNKTKELLNNNDYNLVCLDYNLNYNLDFLKSLTQEQKDKTEFLVNAVCHAGCKMRKKHYDLNSIFSLNYGKKYSLSFCSISDYMLYPYNKNNLNGTCNRITYEDIKNIYRPLGFKHFKLEGRTFEAPFFIGTCVNYMVKPEFQNFIAQEILNTFLMGVKGI